MSQQVELGSEQRPVTVQGTSKKIKLMILLGTVSFFVGLIMMFSGEPDTVAWGVLVMFLGAITALFGKIMRWWKHD